MINQHTDSLTGVYFLTDVSLWLLLLQPLLKICSLVALQITATLMPCADFTQIVIFYFFDFLSVYTENLQCTIVNC